MKKAKQSRNDDSISMALPVKSGAIFPFTRHLFCALTLNAKAQRLHNHTRAGAQLMCRTCACSADSKVLAFAAVHYTEAFCCCSCDSRYDWRAIRKSRIPKYWRRTNNSHDHSGGWHQVTIIRSRLHYEDPWSKTVSLRICATLLFWMACLYILFQFFRKTFQKKISSLKNSWLNLSSKWTTWKQSIHALRTCSS